MILECAGCKETKEVHTSTVEERVEAIIKFMREHWCKKGCGLKKKEKR